MAYDILDAVIVDLAELLEFLPAGEPICLVGLEGLYLPLMPWADTPVLPWNVYHVCSRFLRYGLILLDLMLRFLWVYHQLAMLQDVRRQQVPLDIDAASHLDDPLVKPVLIVRFGQRVVLACLDIPWTDLDECAAGGFHRVLEDTEEQPRCPSQDGATEAAPCPLLGLGDIVTVLVTVCHEHLPVPSLLQAAVAHVLGKKYARQGANELGLGMECAEAGIRVSLPVVLQPVEQLAVELALDKALPRHLLVIRAMPASLFVKPGVVLGSKLGVHAAEQVGAFVLQLRHRGRWRVETRVAVADHGVREGGGVYARLAHPEDGAVLAFLRRALYEDLQLVAEYDFAVVLAALPPDDAVANGVIGRGYVLSLYLILHDLPLQIVQLVAGGALAGHHDRKRQLEGLDLTVDLLPRPEGERPLLDVKVAAVTLLLEGYGVKAAPFRHMEVLALAGGDDG